MGMFLNPGNVMFQRMLNGKFYVDKTELATFLNNRLCTPNAFISVTRPRRFGKTVDADMLVAYYSRGCDSRAQFAGLAVSQDPSFETHLNAHDTIKINVQNLIRPAGGPDGLEDYLTRRLVRELHAAWPEAVDADETYLPAALEGAMAHKGSGFIFVIDEWDCIFRIAADDDTAQRNYLDFLRDLLKDRPYADGCYMTGILSIKKYGLHSALNLFTEYSMVDSKKLSKLVGFNSNEVERLCKRFNMDFCEMARWYDGYIIGSDRTHVYNPRSVSETSRIAAIPASGPAPRPSKPSRSTSTWTSMACRPTSWPCSTDSTYQPR